jgi:glycosyltransferase involved in cell wall biosynthesis
MTRGTLLYCVTAAQSADILLRGQLRWMAQRGWRVHLIVAPGQTNAVVAAREGVQLHEVQMQRAISPRQDLASLLAIIRVLRGTRPDVVNFSTPKAALLCGLASLLLRVPGRLYVVRGVRLEGARGLARALLWLMEWLTLRTANEVVAVSGSVRDSLVRSRLIHPGAVKVIGDGSSNGVDGTEIARRVGQEDRDEVRRALHASPDQFVLLFVGRLNTDKGIEELAEALSEPQCADVLLVTVGNVEDQRALRSLERLGRRWRSVAWSESITPYLAAADALVLPTRREGFPNVVLEGSAAGLPVITTTATGSVDSVRDGVTGILVPPRDPRRLANAIQRLASDPEVRRTMGEAGRAWVLKSFRQERIWSGIDKLHERKLASSS